MSIRVSPTGNIHAPTEVEVRTADGDHIRKELAEISEAENDAERAEEWVDVVILALDGLWRALASRKEASGQPMHHWLSIPAVAAAMIVEKQGKNECRNWPDWRMASPDKAIEHVRDPEPDAREQRIINRAKGIERALGGDGIAALEEALRGPEPGLRLMRSVTNVPGLWRYSKLFEVDSYAGEGTIAVSFTDQLRVRFTDRRGATHEVADLCMLRPIGTYHDRDRPTR